MKTFFLLTACVSFLFAWANEIYRPHIKIHKVENFDLNSGLEHPAWKNTPELMMMKLVYEPEDIRKKPVEGGYVKFLYDDNFLYTLVHVADSDIIVNANKNGGHYYRDCDVIEIFIRPDNARYYWEIYGTPNNLTTRFFYRSRSTLGQYSAFEHKETGLTVRSKVDGTLNDSSDKDKSFTLLFAIPVSELNRPTKESKEIHPAGTIPFAPGNLWRIQVSRYNYNRYFSNFELSAYPQVYGGFHTHPNFAEFELIK